jgi:hypothetical protein
VSAAAAKPRRGRQGPAAKKPPGSSSRGRLRVGEAIYLVAAILLFVLMFFDWYHVAIGKEPGVAAELNLFANGQDAWQALEVIPIFLMLAIAVALGAAVLRLSGSEWRPAIPPAAAVFVLGALAALLILIRIVSPPGLGTPALAGYEFDTSVQVGAFLALVAALGIAYGGWRAMVAEGTSFGGIAKRLESPDRRPKKRPAPRRSST